MCFFSSSMKFSNSCSLCLKGRGTVATGRVEQGTIKVGEEVEVLGLNLVSFR